MRAWKFTLAALAASFIACASAAQSEPVKIRFGWVTPVANWASMVTAKKDLAKNWGRTYELETMRFRGTPQVMAALANGEIEIGNLAFSTFALAIESANIADLRVIADEFQDGVEGYHTNHFAMLKDGSIKTIEDLKGKVIAINAAGAAVDIAARAMLKKHGLEAKRDYTVVEAPFPTMRAMLAEKKVDLVPNAPPLSFDPEMKKISQPLFTGRDALGVSQFIVWTARQSFIDNKHDALEDFFEDMLRIQRWYQDPKNHREAARFASIITRSKPENFGWLYTKDDYYRDPNMLPNLDALQANVDMTHKLGLIKAPLDVRKYTDLSLAKEAARRLKVEADRRAKPP